MADAAAPRGLVRRDECTDMGGKYTSQLTADKPSFELHCGVDYNEQNMAQVGVSSFAACMDRCAAYNTGHIAVCLGVSYDTTPTTLSNCFLKAANNLERLVKTDHVVHTAFLIQSNPPPLTVTATASSTGPSSTSSVPASTPPAPSPTPTPAPAGGGGGPPQAAVIGGAVAGGVVALLVIAGVWRWIVVRKRNRLRNEGKVGFSKEPAELHRH